MDGALEQSEAVNSCGVFSAGLAWGVGTSVASRMMDRAFFASELLCRTPISRTPISCELPQMAVGRHSGSSANGGSAQAGTTLVCR